MENENQIQPNETPIQTTNESTFTPEQQVIFDKAIAKVSGKYKNEIDTLKTQITGLSKTQQIPNEDKSKGQENDLEAKVNKLLTEIDGERNERKKLEQKVAFDNTLKTFEKELGKDVPNFVLRNVNTEGTKEEILANLKSTYTEYVDELKAQGFFAPTDVQTKQVNISSSVGTEQGTDLLTQLKAAREVGLWEKAYILEQQINQLKK